MTVHVESQAHGTWHRVRNIVDVALLVLCVGAVVYFWPASLGGSSHLIVVEGHSMQPTFHLGDIVITRDDPHPRIGDIIVYRIPKGQAGEGMLIIHRVKSIRADGTYQTQGDNRTTPDPFDVTSADILGSPVVAVPHVGRLIGLCSNPLVVGAAAGMLTTLVLWPKKRRQASASELEPGPDPDVESRRAPTVDFDFDADAEAWLREQLSADSFGSVDA